MSANLLPDKLSDLAELALSDFEKCESNPRVYVMHTSYWLCMMHTGRCAVSFAGSVIAQTLGVGTAEYFNNADLSPDNSRKILALDQVSHGNVRRALNCLAGLAPETDVELWPPHPLNRRLAEYGPEYTYDFKRGMRRLIVELREAGL